VELRSNTESLEVDPALSCGMETGEAFEDLDSASPVAASGEEAREVKSDCEIVWVQRLSTG
jgi:hypothetical protein